MQEMQEMKKYYVQPEIDVVKATGESLYLMYSITGEIDKDPIPGF